MRQPRLYLIVILCLLIFAPSGDIHFFNRFVYKRIDECRCKTSVCQQRNVVVDSRAANAITVGQLTLGVVLGDIDYQADRV